MKTGIAAADATFAASALHRCETDGLSLEFHDWRFNLRAPNTEPLVRPDVDARDNADLAGARVLEISALPDTDIPHGASLQMGSVAAR